MISKLCHMLLFWLFKKATKEGYWGPYVVYYEVSEFVLTTLDGKEADELKESLQDDLKIKILDRLVETEILDIVTYPPETDFLNIIQKYKVKVSLPARIAT